MLDDDQGAKVAANDRQHARASSYKPVPSSHTASSSTTQLQASHRILMSRRSLDLGALAAAQAASGSSNSGAGTTNGHGNSSTSTSRFGTLAGSILGAATISSSSGLGSNSQPGSNKRARPSNSHLFGLGGLFNANNATSDGKLSNNMAEGGHAATHNNNMDEREAALMGAVRAANDENTAWQITVEQVPSSEQDSLFLTGSNGGPASASRLGSATPLGRATQAAGRLFLSKSNKRSKPSPSPSSTSSLEKAKKRPHTDTQSPGGSGEPLLVLYVTTGTSSLTLYRSLQQLVQLDIELRGHFPEHIPATKPSALLEIAANESSGGDQTLGAPTPLNTAAQGSQGHTRRRRVFAALGKSLKSNGKRTSPPQGEQRQPQTLASPGNDVPDNGNVGNGHSQTSASPDPSSAPFSASFTLSASQLTNLADYLSGLSSFSDIRSSQEWKRFYKPRPDDHSSPRLEDRDSKKVKKLRSEADLPTNYGSPISDAPDRAPLYAHVLEDSGIGGDMSSHSMMRETSAGTGSSMSIFVEAGLDGRPLTVGDPEVLAYMQSLNTPADTSPLPPSSKAEDAVANGTEGLASSAKKNGAEAREAESTSVSSAAVNAQAEQEVEEPVVSALSESLQDEEAVAEPPVLTPELANDALASLHATSQSSTPAEEPDMKGEDQPLASASTSPPRHSDVLPEADITDETEVLDDPLSRKSSKSNPRSGRKRKASTKSGTISTIGIEDFDIVRVLGKGCAGKVLLSRSKADGALYAVKAIHKQHVLAHRELLHTLTEQSILKKVAVESDNPFVVRMSCSFQNKDNLFLVLDFHPGGDLATQLARWGRLGKDRSRFYAAEIVEGLEGLHAAGIIYRDLKPENILLASDGHIVLTDFGLSKQFYRPYNSSGGDTTRVPSPPWLKDAALSRSNSTSTTSNVFPDGPETTSTFCGTAEYLAPEVLLGNPYSYPVDMWSLGTMVYEMLLGVTPFYNEDHGVMYRRVLHEQISFGSDNYLDADTRALLRGLLQKEPEFRMTTARVKKSKYFEAIDWEYVHSKRYIPPFIPALSADDPEDTQNFDEAFLKMDLGFVDPSDFEEAEVKAKRDGKEPDLPFDEEGRDVFEGYSFHGSPLYEEADEEEDEGSILAEDNLAEEAEDGKVEPEITGDTAVTAGTSGHEQLASTESANTSTSDPGSNSSEDDPDAYETGVTSASGTDDGLSRHTKDTSHIRAHSNALSSLEEVESQTGSVAAQAPSDAQPMSTAQPAQPLTARLHLDAPKNSVDMPRRSMEKEEQPAAPRKSEEAEDWDLLEAMEETEQAVNGQPRRRRVMAGPTLFARGFVDKYKLQIRPVTRAPTPSRSYKSSKNGISSPTAERGLSPSPSAAGMSQISLMDSPDSTKPRRLKAPKLLRASTEWMSNSLPTSPSPRFRLNRNKGSLVPIGLGKGSTKTEPGTRADTHMSTASSSTTLPIEAAGAPLAPLTRHSTRRIDADASSGVENEDPNGDTSSFHSTASKSPNKAAALLA